jgi:hypothetical protein
VWVVTAVAVAAVAAAVRRRRRGRRSFIPVARACCGVAKEQADVRESECRTNAGSA